MDVFEKEITFLSREFEIDSNNPDDKGKWVEKAVKKIATFKELSRTDKDQHKLHFMLVGIMTNAPKDGEDETKMNIDSDALYDLTVKAIKLLLKIDERFTAQDKAEFLADSGAIFNFSMWLLGEKITPFFSNLMSN